MREGIQIGGFPEERAEAVLVSADLSRGGEVLVSLFPFFERRLHFLPQERAHHLLLAILIEAGWENTGSCLLLGNNRERSEKNESSQYQPQHGLKLANSHSGG